MSESQPSLPIAAVCVEHVIEKPNPSPGFSSSGHASSHPFQFVPERSGCRRVRPRSGCAARHGCRVTEKTDRVTEPVVGGLVERSELVVLCPPLPCPSEHGGRSGQGPVGDVQEA